MKQKLIAACLLAVSTNISALELELGIGLSKDPFYTGLNERQYPNQANNKLVGKIAASHTFDVTKKLGIKIWGVHHSLALEKEPNNVDGGKGNGLDMIGTSLIYKIL